MFLTTTELFDNPLNCAMTGGITYCSAFPGDAIFGAVINLFRFRWTSSYIAIPEYKPENMFKAVLHALASSECADTPFQVVMTLPVWDDTPWNFTAIRGHGHMSITLIHIPPIESVRRIPAFLN